jgi:uncharacterized Zn-finger protein
VEKQIVICQECFKICSGSRRLAKHLKKKHREYPKSKPGKKPDSFRDSFVCLTCSKSCNSEKHLRKHIKRRHQAGNKVEMHEPEVILDEKQTLICPDCYKTCNSEKHLRKHMKRRHAEDKKAVEVSNNSEQISCQECLHTFKNSKILNKHIKNVHHNVKRSQKFPCLECGKLLCSKFNLKIHIRQVHERELNFECGECDKMFFSKHARDLHAGVHKLLEERDRFCCEDCSASFLRKGDLTTHKYYCSAATNVFYHECPQCDKKFRSKQIRHQHIKVGKFFLSFEVSNSFFFFSFQQFIKESKMQSVPFATNILVANLKCNNISKVFILLSLSSIVRTVRKLIILDNVTCNNI